MEALSGIANKRIRSHFGGEILSSSCEELRDFLLQPYRGMALFVVVFFGMTGLLNLKSSELGDFVFLQDSPVVYLGHAIFHPR